MSDSKKKQGSRLRYLPQLPDTTNETERHYMRRRTGYPHPSEEAPSLEEGAEQHLQEKASVTPEEKETEHVTTNLGRDRRGRFPAGPLG